MKKIVMLLLILSGCGIGTMEKGNVKEIEFIQKLNEYSNTLKIEFDLLNEEVIEKEVMKELYFMNDQQKECCSLYQTPLYQYPNEIMICNDQTIEIKQIEQRQQYFSEQYRDINNFQQINKGKYQIIVIGNDALEVIGYLDTII